MFRGYTLGGAAKRGSDVYHTESILHTKLC